MDIKISPDEPLVDEKLRITIYGLKPQQKVTVKSSVTEGKSSFSASACFISDSEGNVDINHHPSLDGTYKGVDGMGLFWSMITDPGQPKGQRYLKRIVTTPEEVEFSVFNGHYSWIDCHNTNPTPIVSKQLRRWFLHKTVTRIEIRQGKLRGTLFIPQGKGPFPGVIDMFGGAGGLIESRASLLASRGFISYALPYFDFEDLPKFVPSIDFEYLKNTVDWFSTHPMVIKEGIGVCGTSKGGEIALMLATKCPQIKAVVNINGPPFCSYVPLGPFTDFVKADFDACYFEDEAVVMKHAFDKTLKPDNILKTWKSNARILYIVGEDDQSVHPNCAEVMYKCYPEDQRHKLIIKRYHNAGHLIEPPFNPVCLKSYQKQTGHFVWGGKMEDHQRAQEDSWLMILNFFNSLLLSTDSLKFRTSRL